ncbi:MAG: hypothetical protein ABL925_06520 [Methylococcales bacterium]
MDFGTFSKLLAFVLWPVVFLLVYYLADKKGFMRRFNRIRSNGAKK